MENQPNANSDEERLLALCRAMTPDERDEALVAVGRVMLRRRMGKDPDETIEDCIVACWPPDWPGRGFVDLDDFGDSGGVLRELVTDGGADALLGTSNDDGQWADRLTEQYLEITDQQGCFLPVDCFSSEEEMIQDIKANFLAFFRVWRSRLVAEMLRPEQAGG